MKEDRDAELAREIRSHLELDAEERMADGVSADEAGWAAHRAFGNVTRVREEARALWTWHWAEQAALDLRSAVRPFCLQDQIETPNIPESAKNSGFSRTNGLTA